MNVDDIAKAVAIGMEAEPRERPILFSGPLVRAILEGRKTVTRRPVKGHPEFIGGVGMEADPGSWGWGDESGAWIVLDQSLRPWPGRDYAQSGVSYSANCPFGVPGDLLWVRETWGAHFIWEESRPREILNDGKSCLFYRADGAIVGGCIAGQRGRWRPSIHMPRWASRLTLEVTEVGVERLQDISESEAEAEGVLFEPGFIPDFDADWLPKTPARAAFANAWQRMYAKRDGLSWHANPWVWVVRFRRQEESG